MKSWMLRLGALAVFSGVGCLGVIFAQHRWATPDAPPPDFSQPPVNAEAVSGMNGSRAPGDRYAHPLEAAADNNAVDSVASAGRTTEVTPVSNERPPVDPFQGINQTSLSGNYRNSGADRTADASGASDRGADNSSVNVRNADEHVVAAAYEDKTTAPDVRTLPDARSAPDANSANGSSTARNPFRSGGDVASEPRRLEADPGAAPMAADGAGGRKGLRSVPESGAGVEPRDIGAADANGGASRAMPDGGDLYKDSAARRASGVAAATGTVEAVNDAAQGNSMAPGRAAMPPAGSDRYSGMNSMPGDARGIENADAMAKSIPPMPTSGNAMSGAGSMPGGMAPMPSMPATMPNSQPIANMASLPMGSRIPSSGGFDSTASAVNTEGFGKPGDKKLEGAQAPSVTIEKSAPTEIQVGKEATFQVKVRNTGPVQADDVQVTDVVPQGTRLVNTTPTTSSGPRGEIVWKVGDMKPGEEKTLQIQVMPLEEGEIGSTAVVQFRSAASVRTVATKPELVLDVKAPQQVMIGSDVKLQIKLSNPGTGAASKVVLSAKIPPSFQHPAGNELEFEVGDFHPGESRDLDLSVHAVQAGPTAITLAASGDASLYVDKTANIDVIAPLLKVKLAGPAMRYLDRQAKYTVSVDNPGTAPARNITLTTQLPKGMQFVEASDSGQYDANTNSVLWGLDELPPGQNGSVTLTALAKEAGDQKLRSEVKATGGLSDGADQVTVVEGVAAVNFTVAHVEDPVEVGSNATYEIHVVNQGSKAAGRLQVVAVMPPEIKPVSGDGPSKQSIDGQRIVFEPLARLAPKADVTYRVVGQCLSPGDLRIQVMLQTDDMAKPVVKEEGTRAYKD